MGDETLSPPFYCMISGGRELSVISIVTPVLLLILLASSGCLDNQAQDTGSRVISLDEFSNSTLTEENVSAFMNSTEEVDDKIDPSGISVNIQEGDNNLVEVTFPPLNLRDKVSMEVIGKISAYTLKGLFSNPLVDEVKLNWINSTPTQGATKSELNLQMDRQLASTKDWNQVEEEISNISYKPANIIATTSKVTR